MLIEKMALPLTPTQLAIIKSTIPPLQAHVLDITTLFYRNILSVYPSFKSIFNTTSQATLAQPRALAQSILLYATHLENPSALLPLVTHIAHKHASLAVQPEHYPIVGEYLLAAIKEVLGDVATPEVLGAWGAAYSILADILIKAEASMYLEHKAHRWYGFRSFKIVKKVVETPTITSFYLAPKSGDLPSYQPGQYISVQVKVLSLEHPQTRQYSLSAPPTDRPSTYRISVKRITERDHPAGRVSNALHQLDEGAEVLVTHPQGEFVLDVSKQTPVVLISAGVGATPLTAMLEAIKATNPGRKISWVHSCRNSEEEVFVKEIQAVIDGAAGSVTKTVILTREGDGKRLKVKDLNKGALYLDVKSAQYMICGPVNFMRNVKTDLVSQGVDNKRISMELFGTGEI